MTVVSGQARRRWAAVVVGVAVLCCLPTAVTATTSWAQGLSAGQQPLLPGPDLISRALASAGVAHSGLVTSRGDLGLPDLPRFGDVAAELGGTTSTRVWWLDAAHWRVDVLSPTGEQGTYGDDGRIVQWDYEQSRLTQVLGDAPLRLPRADDLLPPQAARRLLAGVGPGDRVQVLPGRSVIAGAVTEGVRVVPADPRSTIGRIDVWLATGSWLPVAVTVVDDRGVTALDTRFTQLDLGAPAASVVEPPAAPGAVHDTTTEPDVIARIERTGAWALPRVLAGLPASDPLVSGAATYGTGLVRFVVLPLPGRLAGEVLSATRTAGGQVLAVPGGNAWLLSSGALNLVVARGADRQHAYLIAGLVTADVVTAATRALLADPPPRRTT